MFKRTKVCSGLMLAFGGTFAFGVSPTFAQQQLERVEITGSSIKRINAETALPVTVITQDDIKKSGFTSASDLIQALPSMQGFVTASKSVNGGGGGVTTASLHSLGSAYTLVLLNGRRLAPYNTGTTINLSSIPLSAVERIEVLTDGASALYGADAIAGVVNFILKKNSSEGEAVASVNIPQHAGGRSANFSITKGFGDIDKDRFNILIALSGDKQKELNAEQRDFSKTGFIPFNHNGQNLTTWLSSSNSIPGNVFLNDKTGEGTGDAFFSPSLLESGSCGPRTRVRAGVCRFDFSSTVQDIPGSSRVSLFASGRLKVAEAATVFTEIGLSDFKTTPRFAPPAQPGILLTQALIDKHVTPNLGKLGIGPNDFCGVNPNTDPKDPCYFLGPSMNLRVYDAGGRADEYRTKTAHFVVGAEGSLSDWDYRAYLTHSSNKFTDTFVSGYLSSNAFNALIANGSFDPLAAGIGQSTAVLAPAVLHQVFDESKSTIDVLAANVSKPLMKMGGGDMAIGFGGELGRQRFTDAPSAIAMGANVLQPNYTDTPIGGSSGALPFDSTRKQTGVFGELVLPFSKALEVTGALRHDSYDAVKNADNFDATGNLLPSATQGKSAAATTYKLSLRFQPTPEVLIRGSVGTGFKAPTLGNITTPIQAFGNTGFHDCPPGLPAALAALCKNVPTEYNIRTGGNPNTDSTGLEPEKSKQWTLGIRFEPSAALSVGVDLWSVRLKQRIDVVPEDVAFSDGVAYGALFSSKPDPITGAPTLTFTQSPGNLGRATYRGLDFDVVSHVSTGLGRLTTRGTLTYMIAADYEVPGLMGYQSSVGNMGVDQQVTFRWLANISASLETGSFTNTINVQLKPGYTDQVTETHIDKNTGKPVFTGTEVRIVNPDGTIGGRRPVTREVGAYGLIDWQGKYVVNKAFTVTLGVKNIFDTKPPFTIQDEPGTGNMRGYDARYADPLGRQFYATASYKF